MRIKNITEPSRFFEAVNACKGSVELLTGEGDRLNLKSTLCRYIAITQMFREERVAEVELVLSDERDIESLKEYLVTA